MSGLDRLTDAQMTRLTAFFPKSDDNTRVDGARVQSGIISINRNGLSWCDGEGRAATGSRPARTGLWTLPSTLWPLEALQNTGGRACTARWKKTQTAGECDDLCNRIEIHMLDGVTTKAPSCGTKRPSQTQAF